MSTVEEKGELTYIPSFVPEVTNVRGEGELLAVSRLDASAYGGESVDHAGLRAWWMAYPKGIYVLWKDSDIVGAVGIWPIKKGTYNRMIEGKIDEVNLKERDICRRAAGKKYAYWYFADIVLREDHRDRPEKWAFFLLEGAVRHWLSEGNLSPEIHLCALGFTPGGITLLRKFKFLPAGDTPVTSPQGKPVYQRTVAIEDILQALGHLTASRVILAQTLSPQPAGEKRYDVFISYRREQFGIAALIQAELEKKNLNVFVDVDDLRQGRYDEALRTNIANTPNFLVILSPGCTDDCSDEKDWFRREIALAVETGKNIIPILMPGFEFPSPEALPADIRNLPHYESLPFVPKYSKAVISEIIEYLRPSR